MENRNDTSLSGAGSLNGGVYGNIHASGATHINGSIDCYDLSCSGATHIYGSVRSSASVSASGAFTCDQDMTATDEIHLSGSSKVKGILRAAVIKSSGSLSGVLSIYAEEIKISGSLSAHENVEAERIRLSGASQVGGNVNGETIEINISGLSSRIGSIGGAQITVRNSHEATNLLAKLRNKIGGKLVCDLIEGDNVDLTDTECAVVRGKNVMIRGNSIIDRVEYSESLEAEPGAVVKECEKV